MTTYGAAIRPSRFLEAPVFPCVLFAAVLLLIPVSCTSVPDAVTGKGFHSGELPPGDVLDAAYREMKYSILLDELAAELMALEDNNLFRTYGCQLAEHRDRSADELTIASDEYWTGVTAMKYWNPMLIYARILLLMKEGRINHAWNSMMFGAHSWWYLAEGAEQEAYRRYLGEAFIDLMAISGHIIPILTSALDMNSLNLWEQAIEKFDQVIADYPFDTRANSGKGTALAGLSADSGNEEFLQASLDCFRIARRADPFWGWAYQGIDDGGRSMRLVMEHISPDRDIIWDWSDPSQVDYAVLYRFARNCRYIAADEYAVYALLIALENICTRLDADPRPVIWEVTDILRAMGRDSAAETFFSAHKTYFSLK